MSINGLNENQVPQCAVPEEIANKFNWGAFLLTWIWGIGNKSWLTFVIWPASFILSFIPFIGPLAILGVNIWIGIKGNTWAWENKTFASIEEFNTYQKKWAIAGIIVAVLGIVLTVLLTVLIGVAALHAQS